MSNKLLPETDAMKTASFPPYHYFLHTFFHFFFLLLIILTVFIFFHLIFLLIKRQLLGQFGYCKIITMAWVSTHIDKFTILTRQDNNMKFFQRSLSWATFTDTIIFLLLIITVRKRCLRRLCFHRCLSVHRRGVSRPRPGGRGVSRPRPRGILQHALRQTPPQQTATAVDGTHPTGMHSC